MSVSFGGGSGESLLLFLLCIIMYLKEEEVCVEGREGVCGEGRMCRMLRRCCSGRCCSGIKNKVVLKKWY